MLSCACSYAIVQKISMVVCYITFRLDSVDIFLYYMNKHDNCSITFWMFTTKKKHLMVCKNDIKQTTNKPVIWRGLDLPFLPHVVLGPYNLAVTQNIDLL